LQVHFASVACAAAAAAAALADDLEQEEDFA